MPTASLKSVIFPSATTEVSHAFGFDLYSIKDSVRQSKFEIPNAAHLISRCKPRNKQKRTFILVAVELLPSAFYPTSLTG